MAEPNSPLYEAYQQRTAKSKKRRDAESMQENMAKQTQEFLTLPARIAALEGMLGKVTGRNGITVKWPVISLDPNIRGTTEAAATDTAEALVMFNGVIGYMPISVTGDFTLTL